MSVSREEVRAVARLARLRLTDEEVDRFADQLGAILDHVAALDEAALGEAEESAMPPRAELAAVEETEAGAPLRGEEEPPDRLLRPVTELAPTWEEGFFTVPRLAALDGNVTDEGSSGAAGGGGAVTSPDEADADGDDA